MLSNNELLINEKNHHQRLDNFLMLVLKDQSKSYIYKIIRKGEVRVNKGRAQAKQKLSKGDVVRIPPFLVENIKSTIEINTNIDYDIARLESIYEDQYYLIINKPAGIPVHSGSGHDFGVIDVLRSSKKHPFLELVHRLDKETSGCLMLAKDRNSLVLMQKYLANKNSADDALGLKKTYLAMLSGKMNSSVDKVDRLQKNQMNAGERVTTVDNASAHGKEAISRFVPERVLSMGSEGSPMYATLSKVIIYTGRTHQIRVQSADLGHPVAGDRKYGDRDYNNKIRQLGLKRMFLHAQNLEFYHPILNKKIKVLAPIDAKLQNFVHKYK